MQREAGRIEELSGTGAPIRELVFDCAIAGAVQADAGPQPRMWLNSSRAHLCGESGREHPTSSDGSGRR